MPKIQSSFNLLFVAIEIRLFPKKKYPHKQVLQRYVTIFLFNKTILCTTMNQVLYQFPAF